MSRNTALVTDAAKVAAQQDLDDYAAGVAAHLGGDWSGHRQLNVASATYSSTAGVLSNTVARMQLTDDAGVTVAVITPIFSVVNASTDIPPIIALQPTDYEASAGAQASFSVYAASPLSMTYQWQFKSNSSSSFVAIDGAIEALLVLVAVGTANAGQYRVIVSNQQGSVTSAAATLTVV